MKHLKKYFISGLIFLLPVWIVYVAIKGIAGLVTGVISVNVLIGFVLSVGVITLVGFAVRRVFKRYLRRRLERVAEGRGLLGLCTRAFMELDDVADKAREAFSQPVLYKVDDGIYKLGFITDADMDVLGAGFVSNESEAAPSDAVWVYAPLPVTMLGEMILIERRKIHMIPQAQKEAIPLFIMTAGLVEQVTTKNPSE